MKSSPHATVLRITDIHLWDDKEHKIPKTFSSTKSFYTQIRFALVYFTSNTYPMSKLVHIYRAKDCNGGLQNNIPNHVQQITPTAVLNHLLQIVC